MIFNLLVNYLTIYKIGLAIYRVTVLESNIIIHIVCFLNNNHQINVDLISGFDILLDQIGRSGGTGRRARLKIW